jgi:co-chaperonin GroES (HSP10)
LGSSETKLGQGEVVAVAPKFSTIAALDYDPANVQIGDIVRVATEKVKRPKKKK